MHFAITCGSEDTVRLLLYCGADIDPVSDDGTALQRASFRGHDAVVRLLLSRRADVNVQSPVKRRDKSRTALEAARNRGHESIVRLLLENGAKEIEPEEISRYEEFGWGLWT